jgi:hypothetical protein
MGHPHSVVLDRKPSGLEQTAPTLGPARGRTALHALQLLPDSQDVAGYASDGS